MSLSIIAAMSANRVIGINNTIPWKLPEDLKYFKKLTLGKSIIMGRKTFESIGRALPSRENIVLTQQQTYQVQGVKVAHSLKEAIELAENPEIFIIGGAEIYKQSLPLVETVYLTLIEKNFDGDAYFPKLDLKVWQLVQEENHYSESEKFAYKFQIYKKHF
ncbi:MAG: dihydrofolate reductase [Blastocatellia bacterium]|nr:dihydrofolate reductase [Blastocatellia bacterium]